MVKKAGDTAAVQHAALARKHVPCEVRPVVHERDGVRAGCGAEVGVEGVFLVVDFQEDLDMGPGKREDVR